MDRQDELGEVGNPALDSRAFRRALGQFATGVTIVTTADGGPPVGLTVNSFASVSLEPPLVLCSIVRTSRSFAAFERAGHLAINVMASDQVELANNFAGPKADKFEGVAWDAGLGGAPLLAGVAASFECRIDARVEGGDHVILVCEVLHYARHARPLLLYASGRFGLVVEYPGARSETEPVRAFEGRDPLIKQLWDAWSRVSGQFQADRDAEGLSIEQGRVLSHIERYPGATAEFIARHSFLGQLAVEDGLCTLAAAGLITRLPGGTYTATPAGLARLESLRQRAAVLEARHLESIAPEDMQVVRRVLAQLGART